MCENAKVTDLIMFMGQSNMAGRGILCSQFPESVPELIPGAGWEFRAVSDGTKLYPIEEPFGVDENNPDGINDLFSNGTKAKTGSMVTAFCNAYYEQTGVPIVGVSASKGGSRIAQWMPEAKDGYLQDSLERHQRAVRFLEQNGYEIRHRYMVWCQGESDGDRGTSAADYKECFRILWQEMHRIGAEKCFLIKIGKKNVPGEVEAYEEIRRAQEELCDGREIIMAARCLGEMQARGLMQDAFHYYQQAYNECGTEAGETVGKYVLLQESHGRFFAERGTRGSEIRKQAYEAGRSLTV